MYIQKIGLGAGAGFQSHRKGHQAPYNPFKEANQPSGYVEPQPGKAGMRHAGDEAARSGRAFDQSRISFASHSQHRENRHSDRARWPSRENESVAAQDLPSVGHKRHATFDTRSEAKLRRNDQAAHVQQTSKPMEDGELEAHAPGQPLPQVLRTQTMHVHRYCLCVYASTIEQIFGHWHVSLRADIT